jgi:predicted ferric reductase
MLNLGRVTGLVGMIMYALNLVYATRLRFLEVFFGGLNRVYIAHHMLGGLALIFLSLHPLFLALRYIQVSVLQASLMLIPNGLSPMSALFDTKAVIHAEVLAQWAIFLGIIAFWGMVGLLLVTFFIKIPYHLWLFTHKFLGLFFFIGGLHVLFITSDTSKNGPLKWYILTMTAIGIAAFIYRTVVGKILIRKYKYNVVKVETVGGNVTHIVMQPVKELMSYKPGQFVFVRFLEVVDQGISREWHPFTISSAPSDPYLRLSVKGLGDYTNGLAKLQAGAVADIEGAYGRFSYTNFKNKKQIWVAGGIGITPFLSMAKSLPQNDYQVDLYYSVKTSSELIDWDTFKEIYNLEKGRFRVFPFIADQQEGYLSADYIAKQSGGVEGKDIFICGPPPMMASMRKQFRAMSIPGTSIHSEEFGMS